MSKNNAIKEVEKLDFREHLIKYPDAYLGSIHKIDIPRLAYKPIKGIVYVSGYTPAALKCFAEIIDNSVDAAVRNNFKSGTKIHVSLNNNGFSIEDDGHGIPIKFNKKENAWGPQLAFSEERAGSNFDIKNRSTIGMYGVGAAVVTVVSESLELITCDGKRVYSQLFGGNCSHMTEPEIKKKKRGQKSGTYVNVLLDKSIINWNRPDLYCCFQLMNNIMFVYPEIEITADINGDEVPLLRGQKYYEALNLDPWFELDGKNIRGIFGTYDGKSEIRGLVNGTECSGLHITNIKSSISATLVDLLAPEIEGVTRTDISKVLSGLLSFRIINPAFGGLTKNDLTGCDVDKLKDDIEHVLPEITKQLMGCDAFKSIIEENVAKRLDRKLKTKERKAAKARKSLKLVDVYKKGRRKVDTYLLITEGDSAKGLFLQARKPHRHAIYPLRGKIMNAVSADDIDSVANNKILFELSTILGLSLTDQDISKCRYTYIVSLTDADTDGASIHALLMGYLFTYWPDLFKEKRVLRLLTPSHIDVTKNERHHYYGQPPEKIAGKLEYIKGLASLTLPDVKRILEKPAFEVMIPDELAKETIELVLGRSAEKKRIWLGQ